MFLKQVLFPSSVGMGDTVRGSLKINHWLRLSLPDGPNGGFPAPSPEDENRCFWNFVFFKILDKIENPVVRIKILLSMVSLNTWKEAEEIHLAGFLQHYINQTSALSERPHVLYE
jgi:hypothetical protein